MMLDCQPFLLSTIKGRNHLSKKGKEFSSDLQNKCQNQQFDEVFFFF